MTESFYIPNGSGVFTSTEHTRGPWGPDSQHAGPPASLLARAIEQASEEAGLSVARITFEILRPVPVADLRVTTAIVRPGKKVEMSEASLWAADAEVMRARAWRMRTTDLDLPSPPASAFGAPTDATATAVPSPGHEGYLQAIEVRSVKGGFLEPGPATVWFRIRHPLLPDEPISPLTRVLAAADSASGISAVVDLRDWLFVNTDLTVQLHRMPVGEWVCLDARTTLQPNGIGACVSEIHDEAGPIGHTLQTLFVEKRSARS